MSFRAMAERESTRFSMCELPRHLLLHPDGHTMYVTCSMGFLGFYDARDGSRFGIASLGRNPRSIAMTSDGRYVGAANFTSSDVSLVDTVARTHRNVEVPVCAAHRRPCDASIFEHGTALRDELGHERALHARVRADRPRDALMLLRRRTFLATTSLLGLALLGCDEEPPLEALFSVPAFELTDQDGANFGSEQLRGSRLGGELSLHELHAGPAHCSPRSLRTCAVVWPSTATTCASFPSRWTQRSIHPSGCVPSPSAIQGPRIGRF